MYQVLFLCTGYQANVDQAMDIRTFFVTQDREKSTDSVEGGAALESTDSVEGEESTVLVERPTTHSVPSSSGRSASTRSGTFSNDLRTPSSLLLCTPMYVVGNRSTDLATLSMFTFS